MDSVGRRNNSTQNNRRTDNYRGNNNDWYSDRNFNNTNSESYENQNYRGSGRSRNRRGSRAGRPGRGQKSNQKFTNTDNHLWNDDSQNNNQGFPKFTDENSDRGHSRNRENNFGNSVDDYDLNEEYQKYRRDYLRSRVCNVPLMGFEEFEQKFYTNYNGRKSNPATDFQNEKNRSSGWKDNQVINDSNNKAPAILPQPKVINIKEEKLEEVKQKNVEKNTSKKEKKCIDKDSSSSSSNDETVKKIKNLISSKVSAENLVVETKNPFKKVETSNISMPGPKIKKEKSSTDESSTSEDDSSQSSTKSTEDKTKSKSKTNSNQVLTPIAKKSLKSKVEEEVVCLGKLDRVENLVEDENSGSEKSELTCILCEEDGHTSFFCKMICKNCGDKHHNSTMCLKPPNLSRMLQIYMEFTMSQCCQYDPEKKFSYRNGNVQTELLPGFPPPMMHNSIKSSISGFNDYSNEILTNNQFKKRKRSSCGVYSSSKSKKILEDSDSSSSSSSTSESTSTKKRRKLAKKNQLTPTNMNDMNANQHSMPMQFNPFMAAALSQMMAFNPNFTPYKNFPVKREK